MKHSVRLAVLLATALTLPGAFAQGTGATVFNTNCAMCHGPDGKATTTTAKVLHAPSFDAPWIRKQTDAALISDITNGKGQMPSFKDHLSSRQIDEVVAYIRSIEKK